MKTINILLAEDNPGDQKLFALALQGSEGTALNIVGDGAEALLYLRRKGIYSSSPAPELFVVDLNLPMKTGHEVLIEMRSDPFLKHIPVAVFTGAKPTQSLIEICKLNANFYIVKPDGIDRYFGVVKALEAYCRNVVEFPDLKKDYSDELRRSMVAA